MTNSSAVSGRVGSDKGRRVEGFASGDGGGSDGGSGSSGGGGREYEGGELEGRRRFQRLWCGYDVAYSGREGGILCSVALYIDHSDWDVDLSTGRVRDES